MASTGYDYAAVSAALGAGGVAERLKATVLKTVMGSNLHRGFESLLLL
jgi:hypothetical protein